MVPTVIVGIGAGCRVIVRRRVARFRHLAAVLVLHVTVCRDMFESVSARRAQP